MKIHTKVKAAVGGMTVGGAVVALLVAFGIDLSPEQQLAISNAITLVVTWFVPAKETS